MSIRNIVNIMGLLSWVLSRLGCIALFGMMCLTVVDVAGRYIFNSPILGAFEMTEFLVLVMVFSFLGYAQSQKAHVTVDIFYQRMPGRLKHAVSILNYTACFLILAVICRMGAEKAVDAFHTGEKPLNLPIPDYPFIIFMALGAAVMGIEFIRDIIRKITRPGDKPS